MGQKRKANNKQTATKKQKEEATVPTMLEMIEAKCLHFFSASYYDEEYTHQQILLPTMMCIYLSQRLECGDPEFTGICNQDDSFNTKESKLYRAVNNFFLDLQISLREEDDKEIERLFSHLELMWKCFKLAFKEYRFLPGFRETFCTEDKYILGALFNTENRRSTLNVLAHNHTDKSVLPSMMFNDIVLEPTLSYTKDGVKHVFTPDVNLGTFANVLFDFKDGMVRDLPIVFAAWAHCERKEPMLTPLLIRNWEYDYEVFKDDTGQMRIAFTNYNNNTTDSPRVQLEKERQRRIEHAAQTNIFASESATPPAVVDLSDDDDDASVTPEAVTAQLETALAQPETAIAASA